MYELELWVLRDAQDKIIGVYKTYKGLKIALGKLDKKLWARLEEARKENPNHTKVYSFKLELIEGT